MRILSLLNSILIISFLSCSIESTPVDEEGNEIEGNDVSGLLAIKSPWPSMARTIQGDHVRFEIDAVLLEDLR